MPVVKCNICNNDFYAKPHWLKLGWGKYCSIDCAREGRKNGKIVKCFICKKETYKSQKNLRRSKSKKFFCSKSCQTIWRNSIVNIGPKHSNWKGGKFTYKGVLLRSGTPRVCKLCGNEDHRVLAVHHIDNDNKNNDLKNLIWLCNNCHVLIHHYKKESDKLERILKLEKMHRVAGIV